MNDNNSRNLRGFGLIEVIISLAIIALVIGSTTLLGRLVYNGTIISKHRAEASAIAQEGVEMVRQIRDTQLIDGKAGAWDAWFSQGGAADGSPLTLYKDMVNTDVWTLIPDNVNNDTYTYLTTTDGVRFKRIIQVIAPTINPNDNPYIASQSPIYRKVICTVSWVDYGRPQTLSSVTYLTNWQTN